MSDKKLDITPQTKIGALLEDYPQLEATLISVAPAFKKLQNPLLRKTVAKLTSIEQAARIGGINVGELVTRLRQEVGQCSACELASVSGAKTATNEPPDWFVSERIVDSLDVRPLIEKGEHPIGKVFGILGQLGPGEIFELITPFEPAPIIDQATAKGFGVWCHQDGEALFRTDFCKLK